MFKNCVLNPSVSTKEWFKKAGIRAVKTMAQTAGGMLVIGAFNETAWSILIQTTIVTGIASMLTSIAGLPECEECKEE
jgi:hypothetical protein